MCWVSTPLSSSCALAPLVTWSDVATYVSLQAASGALKVQAFDYWVDKPCAKTFFQ